MTNEYVAMMGDIEFVTIPCAQDPKQLRRMKQIFGPYKVLRVSGETAPRFEVRALHHPLAKTWWVSVRQCRPVHWPQRSDEEFVGLFPDDMTRDEIGAALRPQLETDELRQVYYPPRAMQPWGVTAA